MNWPVVLSPDIINLAFYHSVKYGAAIAKQQSIVS
jgi:hypothetical protein